MYDSNNYSYTNGGFSPVEPEQKPPKKSGGVGKVIAGLLAVVVIGGASGYGGAYLAKQGDSSVAASASASDDTDDSGEVSTFTQSTTPTASSDSSSTSASALGSVSSQSGALTTKQVIEKVTPSVALIAADFESAGSSSTGTGIIFSSDGYIVTNAHVITTEVETYVRDNSGSSSSDPFSNFFGNLYGGYSLKTEVVSADTVTVTLSDGTEYDATIVGSDSNTDLAVLKIDATGLTAAEIGDSTTLEMGDSAITLGYPLGLGLSASDGIISGLDKEMSVEVAGGTATMTLIQTDAAINPGNSGGPLLNEYGQVVGITSSKIASSSVDGVGFAIPITDALPILNELMTTGTVKSTVPKIGITGTEITAAVKRYYNLPVDTGVLVASVEAGSCAEAAGLEEGDVIVAADGTDITTMDELVAIKNKHKAGENMTLTLARSDGNIDVELVLDADE
jgi:serine protease Do